MFRQKFQLLCGVGVTALALLGPAAAQTAVPRDKMDALEAQINALQQELKSIKTKVNSAEKSAEKAYAAASPGPVKTPPPPPTAVVKMTPNNQPSICSYDGRNCIAFTSRLHFDVGGYNYSPNSSNPLQSAPQTSAQHLDSGVNARRARIGVLGTFMGDWEYALVLEAGGSSDGFGGSVKIGGNSPPPVGLLPGGILTAIHNAYVRYVGIKGFAIEGGYMDSLYTIDNAMSANDILFLERASSNTIANAMAAGDARSRFGARYFNDFFWAGAFITGPTPGAIHSGSSNFNNTGGPDGLTEQYGGYARMAFHWAQDKAWSFHIGGGVAAVFKPSFNQITGAQTLTLSDRPELRIDPTSIISTGALPFTRRAQVYNVEAAGTLGPLFFQGEYFWFNVDRDPEQDPANNLLVSSNRFQGGYAQASWVITGETRAYNVGNAAYGGIVPTNPVSWSSGGWGAWEIAARYSYMNLNDNLGTSAASGGVAGGKQEVITVGLNWYVNRNMRFMLDYMHGEIDKLNAPNGTVDTGAKFDAVAMRTQVAF